MTEGDTTDELVVLLAGRVRVERAEADGTTASSGHTTPASTSASSRSSGSDLELPP